MKELKEEEDAFMMLVEKNKQGEKNLYRPLSSKFRKLVMISRIVFATRDSDDEGENVEKGEKGEKTVNEDNDKTTKKGKGKSRKAKPEVEDEEPEEATTVVRVKASKLSAPSPFELAKSFID